jgi:hypothetical protein
MRRPMPSPSGRNDARLYLAAGFPEVRTPGAAYDEALPLGYLARCCRFLLKNGFSAEDVVQFIEHKDGEVEWEDEHATSEVHNKMEAAAHSNPRERMGGAGDMPGLDPDQRMTTGSVDRLPSYKPTGVPRNATQTQAMDETLAAVRRIGRGPIGY